MAWQCPQTPVNGHFNPPIANQSLCFAAEIARLKFDAGICHLPTSNNVLTQRHRGSFAGVKNAVDKPADLLTKRPSRISPLP